MKWFNPSLLILGLTSAALAPTYAAETTTNKISTENQLLTVRPQKQNVSGAGAEFLKWVYPPGRPLAFDVNIASLTGSGHTLIWEVRDGFGEILTKGQRAINAGAPSSLKINVAKPPRGVLYLTTTLRDAKNATLSEAQTRAAIFEPCEKPVPMEPFIWGVAAHSARFSAEIADNEVTLMRLTGFSLARADMTWSNIQPEANVWNWGTTDRIYKAYEREGIVPAPLLGYGAKWATTGDANSPDWHQWHNTPPITEDYVRYVREAVRRYKHQTKYWEIWNEADIAFWLGTAQQYATLVDAAVPAIKAEQPEAQVMNGGFSEALQRPQFIPDYLKAIKNPPDIFAVHTHMQFENLLRAEATVDRYLAGIAKRPPVWLNEAGYSSHRGTPEIEQATQLVKKMAYTPAAGFSSYVWYNLRDDGNDDHELEHNFGLVKQDFRPKASIVAANVLMRNLGGREFSGRLNIGDTGYALTYRGAGQTILAAWQQSPAKTPLVLRAKNAKGSTIKLEQQDIFGNVTPLKSANGTFIVTNSSTPQYIRAQGDDVQFELVNKNGVLLDFSPAIVLSPGETYNWPVTVANPFPQTMTGQLRVAKGQAVPVSVAPSASKTYLIPLKRSTGVGSRETLVLSLESPLLAEKLQAHAEIRMATAVPTAPRSLDFELPRSGLVSIFEATPMAELHFKDENDLSAKVHMQKTAAGVKVKVDVTDQTHRPISDEGKWWQGDSIQWALGVDGKMWEWTAALQANGPQMILGLAPDNKTGASAPVSIVRNGNVTSYEWLLPTKLSDGTVLPARFQFNCIVNDNDGGERKGWQEWTPGIGRTKDSSLFQSLIVQ